MEGPTVGDISTVIATVGLSVTLFYLAFSASFFRQYDITSWKIRWLVAWTAGLSLDPLILAIYEIVGVLSPETRFITWRILLVVLSVDLIVVVPFALVYTLAADLGAGATSSVLFALIADAGFAAGFWWLGTFFPAVTSGENDIFSVEGAVGRLGVVGVATAALLSGYGAVWGPAGLLPRIGSSHIRSRDMSIHQAAVRNTLEDAIRARARATRARAALARERAAMHIQTQWSPGSDASTHRADERAMPSPPVEKGMSAASPETVISMGGETRIGPIGRIPLAASILERLEKEAKRSRDIARLNQEVHAQSFMDYSDAVLTRAFSDTLLTVRGRAAAGVGCTTAVWSAIRCITVLITVSRGAKATNGQDPVTRVFETVVLALNVSPDTARLYLQPASLVFVGILVTTSVRGFFMSFARLLAWLTSWLGGLAAPGGVDRSKSVRMAPRSVGAAPSVLFLSLMTGLYFTSSLLLMRQNMPEQYRRGITRAVGDVHFPALHDLFDIIFLVSTCFFLVMLLWTTLVSEARQKDGSRTAAELAAAIPEAGMKVWDTDRRTSSNEKRGFSNGAAAGRLSEGGRLAAGFDPNLSPSSQSSYDRDLPRQSRTTGLEQTRSAWAGRGRSTGTSGSAASSHPVSTPADVRNRQHLFDERGTARALNRGRFRGMLHVHGLDDGLPDQPVSMQEFEANTSINRP